MREQFEKAMAGRIFETQNVRGIDLQAILREHYQTWKAALSSQPRMTEQESVLINEMVEALRFYQNAWEIAGNPQIVEGMLRSLVPNKSLLIEQGITAQKVLNKIHDAGLIAKLPHIVKHESVRG